MQRVTHWRGWKVLLIALAIGWSGEVCEAQLGSGWAAYEPPRKIHLVDFNLPIRKGMQSLAWTNRAAVGSPTVCASYDFDAGTETETFRLVDKRSNRAEIRLENDYGTGSRQFEGFVTFYAPLNDESLFQIWGSDRGATQLMLRGYGANGGELRVSQEPIDGMPLVATNCYGREIRVNVIHLQEDVGGKFLVYLDGRKVLEFADGEHPINNNGKNYHKYGCYGTLKTDGAVVKWRRVRHFKDGKPPEALALGASAENAAAQLAQRGKLLLEENFRSVAACSKEGQR